MLRRATLVLVAAAALAPLSPAAAPSPHRAPPQRVVVRTELVPANDGFDWLDAAAGFGLAIASVTIVLLVVASTRRARRSRGSLPSS